MPSSPFGPQLYALPGTTSARRRTRVVVWLWTTLLNLSDCRDERSETCSCPFHHHETYGG